MYLTRNFIISLRFVSFSAVSILYLEDAFCTRFAAFILHWPVLFLLQVTENQSRDREEENYCIRLKRAWQREEDNKDWINIRA